MTIQYVGFQTKPRGREYSYRVVDPKAEARKFTFTISNKVFAERHVPYQDAASICYQKLQRELLAETPEKPLQQHLSLSDEELDDFLAKTRTGRKRSW
ncbi:MAG TPA: hypothetical protein VFD30_05625 [Terriglobia bacterium]|jgi:hypothetical protein|nr:hypothetical protein [Terriglobia bacterium]